MKYEISNGTILIDIEDYGFIDQWDWKINHRGYPVTIHGNIKLHMLLCPNNEAVHHIDNDKLNNKRSNLVGLTNSEHASLHAKHRWKNYEYPGATFNNSKNPEKKCWQCVIYYNGWTKRLGLFEDPISSSIVYKLVRGEIDGI